MMQRAAKLLMGLLAVAPCVGVAHEMTEKYIPVGHYRALRGADTMLGRVTARDAERRTMTVATEAHGEQQCTLTDATRIWLDRSRLKQPNVDGSFADLQPGREVELHRSRDDPGACAWIKIRAPN